MDSCRYHNASNQMVILRCIGPETFFQEKVVFPFEEWLFRCPPHNRVEIWSHGLMGAEQLDSIHAQDLLLSAELGTPEGSLGGGLAQECLGALAFSKTPGGQRCMSPPIGMRAKDRWVLPTT